MLIFDIEVNKTTKRIEDIGAITNQRREFHKNSIDEFYDFIKKNKVSFFGGHNIVNFDLKHLEETKINKLISRDKIIDTLYLSTLLFPKKPYHNLIKDDKIISEYANNPLNDSHKSFNLFYDSINQFNRLDNDYKVIMYYLLRNVDGISGFFKYIKYSPSRINLENMLKIRFSNDLCLNKNIKQLVKKYPLEIAFALSYVSTNDTNNSLLPAWVLNKHPKVEDILMYLRSTPCNNNDCKYCSNKLTGLDALKRYFNYQSFRKFNGASLQEDAVKTAIANKSLIAVFPTGGGKSLTFQLPALISGENIGGLTVVISPLQSLMKDQVDNLLNKGITNAAYINGLLNPIERKDVFDRVRDGLVNILYIAPESLRSRSIFNLLLKRQVVRFVVDEAHCFSTWGHDFRPDYLYIGDFIKELQEKKNLINNIPVSCFTATAKYDVIEDIKNYFQIKLDLNLELFRTTEGRTNLDYNVIKVYEDENKYLTLRNLLDSDRRPTIVYSSRVKTIIELHKRLQNDGFKVSLFYGRMENDDKIRNQNEFMNNETDIMIATNAFGMGVDKNDVGVVIHYNISDSIENYIQEAGRAGRNPESKANCYILYDSNDLDQHFDLLNFSKVTHKEIGQIWTSIKKEVSGKEFFSKTAFEIGKNAGWEGRGDTDTRVKTSVLALEDAQFIKRGFNVPRVFATSLLVLNMEEASKKIDKAELIPIEEKETSKRIIKSLISNKRKSWADEIAESRVDYLSDVLGIPKGKVITHVNYLREIGVLADDNDLYAKVNNETKIRTIQININRFREIILHLIETFTEEKETYNIKQLNEELSKNYKPDIKNLRRALNYLELIKVINMEKRHNDNFNVNLTKPKQETNDFLLSVFNICEFISSYLIDKYQKKSQLETKSLIDFSPIELKDAYTNSLGLIAENITVADIESSILMMQRLDIMSFEGGFLITYSPLTIKRINENNSSRYTLAKYSKLNNHYKNKNQQIHIVGHYAELMSNDKKEAEEFVSDYFNLQYSSFLDKYFPGQIKKQLDRQMSKERYDKLFGKLSKEQIEIIEDNKSPIIGVAAGPGSGKTTLLVHKLASIIYNEDIKTDQLLMLTFSRGAAIEFKERLKELIGTVANYINITTFHSYAFDILGKFGSLDSSSNIVSEATEAIKYKEADMHKITKTMLVIDEAQDISKEEYELIREIINSNEDIRVIAVGDDDQNIYEFRGSNSKYLEQFANEKKYELSINFRSKENIVNYANRIIENNKNRLKDIAIKSSTKENGSIEIYNYESDNLITPLVQKAIDDNLKGRTAILTRRNEEALIVSGMLTEYKIKNRLIQNESYLKPFNLYELRVFYNLLKEQTEHKIDLTVWNEVLNEFEKRFNNSLNYDVYVTMLNKFIENYNDAYLSDLREFLLETELENFDTSNSLLVANLHKVKGMEFDNVYLMYNNTSWFKDDEMRLIYVGITRAKSFLSIHTKHSIFKNIEIKETNKYYDKKTYNEPEVIEMEFGLSQVNLGYYEFVGHNLEKVLPGFKLKLDNDILMYGSRKVGRLSKSAMKAIEERKEKNYELIDIEVLNLVYWYDSKKEKESLVMIPKMKFKLKT